MQQLVELRAEGISCPTGRFSIDPWQPVEYALITHAHSDHVSRGSAHYLTTEEGAALLRERLGAQASLQTVRYGERININGVAVSFHPAGHILGSSQIRLESEGDIWNITGDFKLHADPTCIQYEPVRCHHLITEATFALPIYRWPQPEQVNVQVHEWWRENQARGRTSVLYAYALGKAERVLAGLDEETGPIGLHGAVLRFIPGYKAAGVRFPPFVPANAENAGILRGRGLVIAPPSAANTPWLKKFGDSSFGFASGWMMIRGHRRRRALDRGFVLSDHADWEGLLRAVELSMAEHVLATHGASEAFVRWLCEQGLHAETLQTPYAGEEEETGTGEE